MSTIEQYKTGKAGESVRLAYEAMKALEQPLQETQLAELFNKHLDDLQPLKVDEKMAFAFIDKADRCAIGDRLCECEFPDAPHTTAVFLEELADAMVEVGKAAYASKEEAKAAITKYQGKPLVVSKVSGEYREICRTWPKYCFYWNIEKHGMKCLKRPEGRDSD